METTVDIVTDVIAAIGIVDVTAENVLTTTVQTIGAVIQETTTTGVVVALMAGVVDLLQALLTAVHATAGTVHVNVGAPSAIHQVTIIIPIPQTTITIAIHPVAVITTILPTTISIVTHATAHTVLAAMIVRDATLTPVVTTSDGVAVTVVVTITTGGETESMDARDQKVMILR